jgi:endonuclease III related protein
MQSLASKLRRAYRLMHARFGHQKWWPGETPLEVCAGAILVQNTNWANVERALVNLKAAGVLEPRKLFALPERKLAQLIRPAGYFNVKTRRLRAFLRVLTGEFNGRLEGLFTGDTSSVRQRLLAINGIGPETADCMLLYAGGHHSFVIDAYTKRIFDRHGWPGRDAGTRRRKAGHGASFSYAALQSLCESSLNQNHGAAKLDYWQDYHAQLVMIGKHYCRPRKPRCAECPLKPLLPGGRISGK